MSEARRKSTTRYFVGGIAAGTLEAAIRRHFESFGLAVTGVEVKRGKHTKQSKGFAFVTAEWSEREAQFLSATHFIEGREVTVSISPPKSKSESAQSHQQSAQPRPLGRLDGPQQARLGRLDGSERPQSMGAFEELVDRSRGSADPKPLSDWLPRPSHQAGKVVSLQRLGLQTQTNWPAPASVFDRQSASFKVFDTPSRRPAQAPTGLRKIKADLQLSILRQHPPASNKHHKYEFLHSSTHINESAANYRFNVLQLLPANWLGGSTDREPRAEPGSRFELRKAFLQAVSFQERVDGFLPTVVPLTSWLASEEARHPENA